MLKCPDTFDHLRPIEGASQCIPGSSLSCQEDEETINQKLSHPCVKEVTLQKPHGVSSDLKPQAHLKNSMTWLHVDWICSRYTGLNLFCWICH